MIAEVADGAPQIARHAGKIAILAKDDGVDHGFLLSPAQAVTTAVRTLAAVADAKGRETFSHRCDEIELTSGHEYADDRYAKLVLFLEKAPLAVDLDATQAAELSVALAAAAQQLDAPQRPRRDF